MLHVKRGFTLIELMIVMIVTATLLGLGVAGFSGIQAQARDKEREADIEIIARGLEQYYKRGNPYYKGEGTTKGTYPGSNTMISIEGTGWCDTAYFKNPEQAAAYSVCKRYYSDALPGVTIAALTPPGKTSTELKHPWLTADAGSNQLITAWIQQELDAGNYVYKPMGDTDALCYGATDCRRFALFYKKETTGEVVIVRSKHQ